MPCTLSFSFEVNLCKFSRIFRDFSCGYCLIFHWMNAKKRFLETNKPTKISNVEITFALINFTSNINACIHWLHLKKKKARACRIRNERSNYPGFSCNVALVPLRKHNVSSFIFSKLTMYPNRENVSRTQYTHYNHILNSGRSVLVVALL